MSLYIFPAALLGIVLAVYLVIGIAGLSCMLYGRDEAEGIVVGGGVQGISAAMKKKRGGRTLVVAIPTYETTDVCCSCCYWYL